MRFFPIIVLLALVSSCTISPEKRAVEKAVKAYNVALIQAYRDVNMRYMEPFADGKEIMKLTVVTEALRMYNSRMIALQDTFLVKNISVKGNAATLSAEEKWTYWWEDAYTGTVTKPKSVQDYSIIYNLKKVDGRWIVDSLEPWNK